MRLAVCTAPLLLAAGCAAFPTMTATSDRAALPIDATADQVETSPDAAPRGSQISSFNIPTRAVVETRREPATEAQINALLGEEMVDAALSPQSIPQFVSTVFGGVLGVPFVMAPDVSGRSEVISGGTGGSISSRDLFRLTQLALRQYGIEVYINNGLVTVGTPAPSGSSATIIRDRTPPETGGRIVQIFPVQTIEVGVLQSLLSDLFPNLGNARITPDPLSNSLIISGPAREVAQVVRALREIDQPRFAGAEVLRVTPVYWPTDNLATSLEQTLTTEGYVVSRQAAAGRAIVILSFPAANQLLIFSKDPALLERARYWVDTLDQPAALGDKPSTFVYQVVNTDAQSLGQLAMGQNPTSAQIRTPVGVPGTAPVIADNASAGAGAAQTRVTAPTVGGGGAFLGGRILTDPVGNRIIFTGTATDFAQLRGLMMTLDIPAPQVVIEVMLAEVTLTDRTALGINFSGVDVGGDGTFNYGTEGIALGDGGFLGTFVGPDFRARLNAQASNNRVNILQRPRLVVRSGGSARFQVGTDVPIITSQRATDTSQNGNGTDVLQSVQYRQTGVILDLKPVVYGDRVDIQISQENSSAGEPLEGISSPTILNRSLTTQIAIRDGQTGVLGGLIGNTYNKTNSGVPFLKDIPLIGSAFQNNTVSGDRTELLILITPHVIRGDEDMADFVDTYSRDMNAAFRTGRGWSYTLTPFSFGSRVRGIGFDLPSATGVRPPRVEPPADEAVEPEPATDPEA
ncbi:secretin N-terminal domain-containing protein [Brevundimonas sp.]